jgi:hypothetical protein
MNSTKERAEAIPLFTSTGTEEATLDAVERANKENCKVACNEFLFRWVPPGMTIAEFEQVSCGLFARILEEWEKRAKVS